MHAYTFKQHEGIIQNTIQYQISEILFHSGDIQTLKFEASKLQNFIKIKTKALIAALSSLLEDKA